MECLLPLYHIRSNNSSGFINTIKNKSTIQIKVKTMTIAELGILLLHDLHKEKNKDAVVTIINITENSIHDFASVEKFLVKKYDEEQYVDVISILQSEGKIMAITKNH